MLAGDWVYMTKTILHACRKLGARVQNHPPCLLMSGCTQPSHVPCCLLFIHLQDNCLPTCSLYKHGWNHHTACQHTRQRLYYLGVYTLLMSTLTLHDITRRTVEEAMIIPHGDLLLPCLAFTYIIRNLLHHLTWFDAYIYIYMSVP